MTTSIHIANLNYTIGDKPILCDVNLTVHAGDYLSIIGPNGAGKTTLIKCLTRILKISPGTIRINDRDLDTFSQKELARLISYVAQVDGHCVPYTVQEFVMLGRYAHLPFLASPSTNDRSIVREAMNETDIEPLAQRTMSTLSGGERQKVMIAAALAQQAPIMLLDEPITFLDPHYQYEINRLLKRLNKERGVTIVAVSHDINSAVLNSKRILALKNGRVAFCGDVRTLMTPDVLHNIFQAEFIFASHPSTDIPIVVPEH